jgi:hypothetical protein
MRRGGLSEIPGRARTLQYRQPVDGVAWRGALPTVRRTEAASKNHPCEQIGVIAASAVLRSTGQRVPAQPPGWPRGTTATCASCGRGTFAHRLGSRFGRDPAASPACTYRRTVAESVPAVICMSHSSLLVSSQRRRTSRASTSCMRDLIAWRDSGSMEHKLVPVRVPCREWLA